MESEAAAGQLDQGSIDSQAGAARAATDSSENKFVQDLQQKQGNQAAQAAATERRIERETGEAEKKSLTQQVMLNDLNLQPPSIDGPSNKR